MEVINHDYMQKRGFYIYLTREVSVNIEKGATIFIKSTSNSISKYETYETTKNLMILIHEDVLQHLQKISVLFWREITISGFIIYSNL